MCIEGVKTGHVTSSVDGDSRGIFFLLGLVWENHRSRYRALEILRLATLQWSQGAIRTAGFRANLVSRKVSAYLICLERCRNTLEGEGAEAGRPARW